MENDKGTSIIERKKTRLFESIAMFRELLFDSENIDIYTKMQLYDVLKMYSECVDSIIERIEDDELLV